MDLQGNGQTKEPNNVDVTHKKDTERHTTLNYTTDERWLLGECATEGSYLAAHVDWYAHDDDWDGDACYQGDDHRRAQQHAHLPHNLAGLRPWLLPPERAS